MLQAPQQIHGRALVRVHEVLKLLKDFGLFTPEGQINSLK